MPFDQVASLASRRTDALRSSFRPTYNMAANLVRRYTQPRPHHLLNLSFAQFHADRDVVALERQLDRSTPAARAPARGRRRATSATSTSTAALTGELDDRPARPRRRPRASTEALRRAAARRRRRASAPRRAGRGAEPRAPAQRRQPRSSRSARAAQRRAARPRGLRRRRRGASATIELPDAVRAAQPGVPAPDRRAPAPGEAARRRPAVARDDARIAELEDAARRAPAAPTIRSSTQQLRGRGGDRAPRTRRAPHSSGASAAAARAWPGSSTACCACSRRGATSTAGRSPTPASSSPGSTPRPTCCSPRRSAKGCSTACAPPELAARGVVLHLRAARARRPGADATGALADEDGRQAGARDRAHRAELDANEDDAGLPETRAARSRVHALRVRVGGGRRPRRRARRRRDDRRRLRPQREAVHRPAPPGRRRRPGPASTRAPRAARRPTRATAACVAASSVAAVTAATR